MDIFHVETDEDGDTFVVRLFGELDLAAFERVESALASSTRPDVRIDMRGLTFIDSSGIRAVLAADARSKEQGGRLTIVPGERQVHHVFVLTGLDSVLSFVEPDGVAEGRS